MLILFLIVFIDLLGFGIIIPLLPFYGEHCQADPFTVSLIMAIYSLGQFIAAPFWGRLSDTIGRRPVLIISLLGAVLSYIWLGFATPLWMLFAARLVGCLMAGNISTAFAYIATITTAENRAKGVSNAVAESGAGFIPGPGVSRISDAPAYRTAAPPTLPLLHAAVSCVASGATASFP